MKLKYTKTELQLLITCFLSYTAAYISRTNLSPALDAIQQTFGATSAQIGLLPTLFALPYAIGQTINGGASGYFAPHKHMLIGLLGSAAANIVFSFSNSYMMILVVWCINGAFQSMIWTPIMRILSERFRTEIKTRAIFFISMSLIIGYLAAWFISSFLTSHFSWNVAFCATGMTTAALALISFFVMRNAMESSESRAVKAEAYKAKITVKELMLGTDIIFMLLCCVVNGYVRDSIMNWAPKILLETQNIKLDGIVGVILVIPTVNFAGIQFGKQLYKSTHSRSRRAVEIMMLLTAVFAGVLLLIGQNSLAIMTCMLACCSAMAYGLNPMFTSIVPLDYADTGRIGLVAGMIDSSIYLGSAFSGVLAGYLRDVGGWSSVFASWVIFSLVGFLMVILATKRIKRLEVQREENT